MSVAPQDRWRGSERVTARQVNKTAAIASQPPTMEKRGSRQSSTFVYQFSERLRTFER